MAAKSWMKLDNAAKIYPAAKRRNWTALFRLSACLTEPVDPVALRAALESCAKRFPTFTLRLRRGMFWFYLEHIDGVPKIQRDVANPCVRMDLRENRGFMFRVRYFENTVAVEIYHVLTDGTGGFVFLKTLVAEYLRIKYGAVIPRDTEILDCSEAPKPDELEDAFFKYAKSHTAPRGESSAYYFKGTLERPDVIHITNAQMPLDLLLAKAKEKKVTLTEYLTAVLILAIDKVQRAEGRPQRKLKPVKICVPINLRKFYPTHTLRNFSNYTNPGIDPRYGLFSFDEVLSAVHHHMGSEVTEKKLNAKIATNVQVEKVRVLRLMPLFIKNIAMKMTFKFVGDRQTSSSISNLGAVKLPPEMEQYVTRMDFILGPLSRNRVIAAMLSYQNTVYFNFTRIIKETFIEREFFRMLVKLGIPVRIESNQIGETRECE
ncbi:MAG TPA: hypothetical protein PK854_02150 [Oscillospiraceae bacterium]|nr:hypothetical protein [Oscillospiraceae bacterium]HPS34046.1 hypothetical protein [Oscillospiraceae bacterium]